MSQIVFKIQESFKFLRVKERIRLEIESIQ
jgi:hypothetical protein